jgi:hypothetical protein
MDADGRRWMQMDADGCRWTQIDADLFTAGVGSGRVLQAVWIAGIIGGDLRVVFGSGLEEVLCAFVP